MDKGAGAPSSPHYNFSRRDCTRATPGARPLMGGRAPPVLDMAPASLNLKVRTLDERPHGPLGRCPRQGGAFVRAISQAHSARGRQKLEVAVFPASDLHRKFALSR